MPLPIPFYLRTSQNAALTHAQLDGNLSILSTKIDNTTCSNIGSGIGIFHNKEVGANDGVINLYSLSGTGGLVIGLSGESIVFDGSGLIDTTFWEEFGVANSSLKDVKGTYNTSGGSKTVIAGGDLHTVHDVKTSFVGGGSFNRIFRSPLSSIIGGKYATISGQTASDSENNILIGVYNASQGVPDITNSNTCYMINTTESKVRKNAISGIIGSSLSRIDVNILEVTTKGQNAILGGEGNNIASASASAIIGGSSNTLQYDLNYSGGSAHNIILGGAGSTIMGQQQSIIMGGKGNNIQFGENDIQGNNGIVGGIENVIRWEDSTVILGGTGNTMSGRVNDAYKAAGNSIIGGFDNAISSASTSVIIGGNNNTLNPLNTILKNSVIIGGNNISGTTDNTVYVPHLNIKDTDSGTAVASLAIQADGTVITGSTIPVGASINVDASADPNVFGYSTVNYTATSLGGTIYLGDSELLPIGFQVKLIRTGSTTSALLGGGGTSVINSAPTRPLPTASFSVVTCTANTNVWYCSTGTVI